MKHVFINAKAYKEGQVIEDLQITLTTLKVEDALEVFKFVWTIVRQKPDMYNVAITFSN